MPPPCLRAPVKARVPKPVESAHHGLTHHHCDCDQCHSVASGVQQLRTSAREGFAKTLSGADLIVGARSGPINLLLYSIFRIGDATSNVTWQSYQIIAKHPDVAWTIPISLGDSHRGFRVMGTTLDYFTHYRFAATGS